MSLFPVASYKSSWCTWTQHDVEDQKGGERTCVWPCVLKPAPFPTTPQPTKWSLPCLAHHCSNVGLWFHRRTIGTKKYIIIVVKIIIWHRRLISSAPRPPVSRSPGLISATRSWVLGSISLVKLLRGHGGWSDILATFIHSPQQQQQQQWQRRILISY